MKWFKSKQSCTLLFKCFLMKKIFPILIVLLLFSCSEDYDLQTAAETVDTDSNKQSGNEKPNVDPKTLFNIYKVPVITLQFSLVQWNKLLSNYDLHPKNEKKVVAGFTYSLDGSVTQLDSIGLKLKGNTSRRRPEGNFGEVHNSQNPDWHHCHFSLDFSKNRPAQLFAGRNKISLKWFKDDAAYAREVYSYDLFRRFGIWTSPRASYCRVYIQVDGTPLANYGVYAIIEQVDEDYIAQRQQYWGSAVGDLWKCGWAGSNYVDFVQTQSIGVEDVTLNPATSLFYAYDLKTNEDNLAAAKANLIQFINDLNTKTGPDFQNWISTKMDVPLFMRTYATNVVLGMWDDYWGNGNNFYFYFAPNGKAYFIPYDYDNTLGTSGLIANSGTHDPLNWGTTGKPLVTKILAIPEYQAIYKKAIKDLINPNNNFFAASKSMVRIRGWQNMIAPYVSNDTEEDMLIEDKPASWGNQPNYRLLSGNNQGGNSGPANFFSSRAASISW